MSEPEKVYAVCTRWEEASVCEANVVKRTAKMVYIKSDGNSSGFGCRNAIPKDDQCLAPTRAEALRRGLQRADTAAKDQQCKLTNALNYVARLHKELEKEITRDQPK